MLGCWLSEYLTVPPIEVQTSACIFGNMKRTHLTPFSQGFSQMMPYLASAASTGSSPASVSSGTRLLSLLEVASALGSASI